MATSAPPPNAPKGPRPRLPHELVRPVVYNLLIQDTPVDHPSNDWLETTRGHTTCTCLNVAFDLMNTNSAAIMFETRYVITNTILPALRADLKAAITWGIPSILPDLWRFRDSCLCYVAEQFMEIVEAPPSEITYGKTHFLTAMPELNMFSLVRSFVDEQMYIRYVDVLGYRTVKVQFDDVMLLAIIELDMVTYKDVRKRDAGMIVHFEEGVSFGRTVVSEHGGTV